MVCSKAINASLTLGAKVLGLVENMSCYVCRQCGDTVYLFGKDKGQQLARMMEIPFLGSVPIDPLFSEAADTGTPIVELHPESITAQAFSEIARTLVKALPPKEVPEAPPMESKPCPGSHSHAHHHHHHHHGPAEPDHGQGTQAGACCAHHGTHSHGAHGKPEESSQ